MKKAVSVLIVLLLCISMAVPAFAADSFVRSISYKDAPGLVTTEVENVGPVAAWLVTDGEEDDPVYATELVVTPVSAVDSAEAIPDASREILKQVYEDLTTGKAVIPFEKLEDEDLVDPVIRDLFDVTVLDDGENDALETDGVQIRMTFNLGVKADTEVYVMSYRNGSWDPAAEVVNNGDGKVTVTFDHLCPVAVIVNSDDAAAPPQTGDATGGNLWFWAVLMAMSAAVIVVLSTKVYSRKKHSS